MLLLRPELIFQVAQEVMESVVLVLGNDDVDQVSFSAVETVLAAEEGDHQHQLEDRYPLAGDVLQKLSAVDRVLGELLQESPHISSISSTNTVQVERIGPGSSPKTICHVRTCQFGDVARQSFSVVWLHAPPFFTEHTDSRLQLKVREARDTVRAVADLPVILFARIAVEDVHLQQHGVQARTVRDQPVATGSISCNSAVNRLIEAHGFDRKQVLHRCVDFISVRVKQLQKADFLCGGSGHNTSSDR